MSLATITADKFTNFASSTLAGGASGAGTTLLSGDANLNLNPGDGALFPSSGPFYLVLGAGTATPEVVKVTTRTTDNCAIVRAQDGTTAQNWPVGTVIQLDLTAANLNNLWNALAAINNPTSPSLTGLVTFIPANGAYDAIQVQNSHDNTYSGFMGYADPSYGQGAGAYLYDGKNAGYVFSQGTKNGITFTGTVTALQYRWGGGVSGSLSNVTWDSVNKGNVYWTPQAGGSALGHVFVTWNGSAQVNAFSVGGQFAGTLAWVDNGGHLTLSAADAGNTDQLLLQRTNGVVQTIKFGLDASGTLYAFDSVNNGYIFQSATKNGITFPGTIIVGATPKLATGKSLSGVCGAHFFCNGTPQTGETYPCQMTAAPASITFDAIGSTLVADNVNGGSWSASNISTTGFIFFWSPVTSNAESGVISHYTITSNCIWSVEPTATASDSTTGTYTHHCENCGLVRSALSIHGDIHYDTSCGTQAGQYSLRTICTRCGTIEVFNTALPSANEAGWDTVNLPANDYRNQVHFIRQIQQVLGLPVLS